MVFKHTTCLLKIIKSSQIFSVINKHELAVVCSVIHFNLEILKYADTKDILWFHLIVTPKKMNIFPVFRKVDSGV